MQHRKADGIQLAKKPIVNSNGNGNKITPKDTQTPRIAEMEPSPNDRIDTERQLLAKDEDDGMGKGPRIEVAKNERESFDLVHEPLTEKVIKGHRYM